MDLAMNADLLKMHEFGELMANSGGPPELTDLGKGLQRRLDAMGKPLAIEFEAADGRAVNLTTLSNKVFMQRFVVVRADIAARKHVFQVLEKRRVDGHYVFEMPVDGAILHHEDLAVALDHLGFDLPGARRCTARPSASRRPESACGFPARSAGTANRFRAASRAAA